MSGNGRHKRLQARAKQKRAKRARLAAFLAALKRRINRFYEDMMTSGRYPVWQRIRALSFGGEV
jgi:hypothetical protein